MGLRKIGKGYGERKKVAWVKAYKSQVKAARAGGLQGNKVVVIPEH